MNIALHDDATGRRIYSVGCVSVFHAWAALKERIAAELGIHPLDAEEAIQIKEDDDGIERVTIDGKPAGHVRTVIMGLEFGAPDELTPANRNDDPAQAAVRDVMESAS